MKVSPLAIVHRVCPLCLMARRWPGSPVAKVRAAIARRCPFCLADAKMQRERMKNRGRKGDENDATG